jgi:hypothetical protein
MAVRASASGPDLASLGRRGGEPGIGEVEHGPDARREPPPGVAHKVRYAADVAACTAWIRPAAPPSRPPPPARPRRRRDRARTSRMPAGIGRSGAIAGTTRECAAAWSNRHPEDQRGRLEHDCDQPGEREDTARARRRAIRGVGRRNSNGLRPGPTGDDEWPPATTFPRATGEPRYRRRPEAVTGSPPRPTATRSADPGYGVSLTRRTRLLAPNSNV